MGSADRRWFRRRAGSLIAAALIAVACMSEEKAVAPEADPSSMRKLGAGEITGLRGAYGNHAWLGLRYAAAPARELRFRAPRPFASGAGAKQALKFGAACPQIAHPLGIDDVKPGTPVGDEDCLFLNVYAPRLSPEQAASARLPVMVWMHGGGNVIGRANGYDGGNLAQRERVVVVTIHYRLGPLGWFRHAALREGSAPEEASGNYGTLDQIEALRWVQRHIAGFGGDPGNVTIFGESAGARNALALLVSPPAQGLFHRVISQSGGVWTHPPRAAEAFVAEGGDRNSANEVLARMLVADGTARDAASARAAIAKMPPAEIADYLQRKPPAEVLAAYSSEEGGGLRNMPDVFADGAVVPAQDMLAVFAAADGRPRVPIMLGTNRDENKTFMISDPAYVRRFTPLYVRMRDPDRYNAIAQAHSRAWKVRGADAPAQAIAQGGGTAFVYRFDWDEEPSVLGADLGVMLGAGHGVEIPFVFGHFQLGRQSRFLFPKETRATREQLAHAMMSYWAEFARNGRPGKGRGGALPEWPPFAMAQGAPQFMVFDTVKGGGVRVQPGKLDIAAVVASVQADGRLRDDAARCTVLRELLRYSPPNERGNTLERCDQLAQADAR
jgi:para-nitrobenzyl esterase